MVEAGEEGLLTEQEQLRITMPIRYRSLAELKAPFGDEGRFAGLRLEHIEATHTPDPEADLRRRQLRRDQAI